MKIYKVSLSVLTPQNYEIQVKANSELEAAQLAIKEFDDERAAGSFEDSNEEARSDFELADDFDDSFGISVEPIDA